MRSRIGIVLALAVLASACGGGEPADAPPQGAQSSEGEGWRLLLSEKGASEPYRTGIATDREQYLALLTEAGFGGVEPEVDFEREVAVWWGIAYGSSCNDLRFEGIDVSNGDRPYLAPVVADRSGQMDCTDDLAGGFGFVVAVDRSVLPAGPFAVTYTAGRTTGALADAATSVDADLTRAGATAEPGPPPVDPLAGAARSGDTIEVGFPWEYAVYAHCGVETLGELNDVLWVAAEGELDLSQVDPMPEAWSEVQTQDQFVVVEVLIAEGDPPTLTATANGVSVVYEPAAERTSGLCD